MRFFFIDTSGIKLQEGDNVSMLALSIRQKKYNARLLLCPLMAPRNRDDVVFLYLTFVENDAY
jgi:hypothetical protein